MPALGLSVAGCNDNATQSEPEREAVRQAAAAPTAEPASEPAVAAVDEVAAPIITAAKTPDAGASASKVVWVLMKDKAPLATAAATKDWKTRGANVHRALTTTAAQSQSDLRTFLTQKGAKHRPFWIVNAVKVEADQATIDQIAQRSDVAKVVDDHRYAVPPREPGRTTPVPKAIEWGLTSIHAPEVWAAYGAKGDGVVVANIDTGVQFDHPALVQQYRGSLGAGSFDHNYNWFDPSNACGKPSTAPCDNVGHGTHTMGTMVGDDGDPGDNQIGVAPHARWIAAKGCESSWCTTESLLASAEWVLAPTDLNGQNPRTDLRPHIVNNSWGGGQGDTFFQAAVQAWVDAGIFPAFSAGNSGSYCNSANSPGDYPESYASGAYDEFDTIAYFSSRGPSFFGIIKPNLSAPGVNVRSSVPGGSYDWYSGTSMASPHLAGSVALMWSAAPALVGDIASTRVILDQSAVDTEDLSCGGDAGNNNTWGEGRLNVLAAVDLSPVGPTGTLQGTVTQAAGGLPLVGATLLVQGGPRDRTVTSGADGTYKTRLSTGSYTVTVRAFGFIEQVASNVTIAEGAVTQLDFSMSAAPSYKLSGTVRTDAGTVMAGAQVTIVGTPLPTVTTDGNGQYSFPSVPAGTYDVRATGSACYAIQTQPVTVGADATLDFTLVQRVDEYGYRCIPSAFSYIQGDTLLPMSGYQYSADVKLPFPFTLYGQTYETATVTALGYLSFPKTSYTSWYNTPIPDPVEPNATIYTFWDDIYLDYDSSVLTREMGVAPNRQFVIEWRNVASWQSGIRTNFEVVLSENGNILMQYMSGADLWQQGLQATLGIENATGTVAFQYSYNQASVTPETAILYSLPPHGTVQGMVTDANDTLAIAGATVEASQNGTVVASTTTLSSGFYRLMLPAGSYTLTATKANYAEKQATVSVALDQTVEKSFALKTGVATLSPGTLQLLMPIGQTRTRTLTLGNTGSGSLTFSLKESGGKKLAVAPTRLQPRTMGFNANAKSTKGLFTQTPQTITISPDAAGDILRSFVPAGVSSPWGVGFTSNLWLSDYANRANTEFTPEGVATGRQWPDNWSGMWAADMAYDSGRDLMCQLDVGGDNGIHCWKPGTGVVTDTITGSFPWTQISQRGLAYRPDDDSFYVGGWNDGVVYHVKGLGASDKGALIGSCSPADGSISGLTYNSAAGVLWVATNSYTDTIYELNPDDCTVVAVLNHPTPGYAGAGLEMDDAGNLWMIGQNNQTVYLMDSGVPSYSDVPWLTPTPTSGTVAKGGSAKISVKVDTTGMAAGVYLATLYIQTTAAKQPLLRVPVSLVVTAYQQAVVAGGSTYTDSLGDPWAADKAYAKGSWGYVQKSKTDSTKKTIGGTTEQPLFKTQRIDPYAYRFDNVPNGIYEIDMNFAELAGLRLGKRLYDVIIENTLVLPAHDIAYEVGNLQADKHIFFVEVTDGQMDVRLIPRAGSEKPVINSLRVTHRPDR